MIWVNSFLDFVKLVVFTTFNQLFIVLGGFFIFGIILYFLARFTRTVFVRSIGSKADVIWTGWLGTPVHELGHALFCIIFRHQIVSMKLYDPNPYDGSLGYVNHAYNPRSAYQKIGNFFIGAGPIILGSFVLYAAMYYLLPNKNSVLQIIDGKGISITSFASILPQVKSVYATGKQIINALFTAANIKTWMFWIFLYISLCVASHMELSPPDLKGLWSGLTTLIILLLVINTITLFLGYDIHKYILIAHRYSGLFIGLFIFATIISAANFLGSFLLLSVYSLAVHRRLLNPIS